MNLYIDCEWNDYKGQLISVALCAEDGREFYEVTNCEQPSEWIAKNVMPILEKQPVPMADLQRSLGLFLAGFDAVHVVADWPEDIAHFCNLLIVGPGMRLDTPPLTMQVFRGVNETSKLPHNALWDARAIREELLRANAPGEPPQGHKENSNG